MFIVPKHSVRLLCLLMPFLAISLIAANISTLDTAKSRQRQKEELTEFNSLIGGWRGVGMVKRNSSRGAWRETADWVWEFRDDKVAVRCVIEKGKVLKAGTITFNPSTEKLKLLADFSEGQSGIFTGQWNNNKLILLAENTDNQTPLDVQRVTITRLNDKRTLMLFERRPPGQTQYSRIVEVGYTREGVRLAYEGASDPICIVTGGKGTMRVSYQGKDYYVCCTGCKQAFDDDPAGIIAEYQASLKKAKDSPK